MRVSGARAPEEVAEQRAAAAFWRRPRCIAPAKRWHPRICGQAEHVHVSFTLMHGRRGARELASSRGKDAPADTFGRKAGALPACWPWRVAWRTCHSCECFLSLGAPWLAVLSKRVITPLIWPFERLICCEKDDLDQTKALSCMLGLADEQAAGKQAASSFPPLAPLFRTFVLRGGLSSSALTASTRRIQIYDR